MTRRGVWDIQDVRDKLLAGDPWNRYNALFTSGINIYGELGQNNQDGTGIGTKLAQVDSQENFAHVGGCDNTSFGVTEDGKLYSWGASQAGRLANGGPNFKYYSSPVQVPGTTWAATCYSDTYSMMATKTDGSAWFWGGSGPSNYARSIAGWPYNNSCSSPVLIPGTWTANPNRIDQQKMIFTEKSGFAIDASGNLYSWGSNGHGCLGLNAPDTVVAKTQVGTDSTWQWVTGYHHSPSSNTAAVKTDGTLWMVGGGGAPNGCLGLGPYKPDGLSSPTQIGTLDHWTSVTSGQMYWLGGGFAACDNSGKIFVWGATDTGTFGTNQADVQISSPYNLPGGPYKMVQICEKTMIRMKGDDTLWVSGDVHAAGMVPETGHQYMSSPVQVPGAVVGFSSDKIGMWGSGTYLNIGVIGPNLTPAQL
tara:strand:+ start:2439 stop:3698 length:1260 start_codon:yes stop_codon:yes gene_type:complete